jgi:hypothetical protein
VTTPQPNDAARPPTAPDPSAAELAALRVAFARCYAALVDAQAKMAMATGLGMTEPSRIIVQTYARGIADNVAGLAGVARASGWRP